MCGIAGQLNIKGEASTVLVEKMTRKMIHRGPDSEGFYFSGQIGLGMRRLKIVDLSTGDQPIYNEDKTICTVFNGEIYNYKELRKGLEEKGHSFYTNSDTEVLVHLYEEYGDDFVKRLNGMFGLAIWDENNKKLLIARDRAGEKSIYYYFDGDNLLFASELKSILEYPIKRDINYEALHYYMVFGRVPSPLTIIEGVRKLEPAEVLVADCGKINVKKYWSLSFKDKLKLSEKEIANELCDRLEKSVKIRMEADVPLGAFLSGGVDSSAVVAMMAKNSREPIETFSIGFKEKDYSEVDYAREVSEKYNTKHREFIIDSSSLEDLEKLVWHMDEPFSDYSMVPTHYVSEQTKKHVTVALTGDGADELFAGYETYKAIKIAQFYTKLPKFLRNLFYRLTKLIPDNDRREGLLRYVHKLKRMAETQQKTSGDPLEVLLSMTSGFTQEFLLQEVYHDSFSRSVKSFDANSMRRKVVEEYDGDNKTEAVLYSQFKTLLPDMFFSKVDRCSMAASLEPRSPFVDYKLVEFIARIPFKYKVKGLRTKSILKKSLRGLLSDNILFRHKKGFSMPLNRWIKEQGVMEEIKRVLLGDAFVELNYFKTDYIKKIIKEHSEDKVNNLDKIWRLYMFALWCEAFIKNDK